MIPLPHHRKRALRSWLMLPLVFCAIAGAQEPKPPVEIELTVVEYTLPAGNDPLSPHTPTAEEIGQLPEKSRQPLERISAAGNPGEELKITHVAHPAPDSQASLLAFAPGETGTKASAYLHPNLNGIIEADIVFHFRKQGEEGNDKATTDIDFTIDMETGDNSPVVIYTCTVPGHEGKFISVIARVRLAPSTQPPSPAE